MPPTWLTTKQEYDNADSIDQDKLLHGLETRTSCCLQVVPTDCLNSVCGHGDHTVQEPFTRQWTTRDDLPCTDYAPEPALTYHTNCPRRRSYHQALEEATAAGSLREQDEGESQQAS